MKYLKYLLVPGVLLALKLSVRSHTAEDYGVLIMSWLILALQVITLIAGLVIYTIFLFSKRFTKLDTLALTLEIIAGYALSLFLNPLSHFTLEFQWSGVILFGVVTALMGMAIYQFCHEKHRHPEK